MIRRKTHHFQSSGFTLVELLVILAIFIILATLAYSGYMRHAKNTRLSQAHSVLLSNSGALDRYYQTQLSYKANSTTWMTLPVQQTEHFCVRLVGNPRGAVEERYSLKAVAFDSTAEPRVLKINQDGLVLVCAQSSSRCSEPPPYFSGGSSVDKNCTLYNN